MNRAAWLLAAGLIAAAVVASLSAPLEPRLLGPSAAEAAYGEARSRRSAAPSGVLASARVLERMGFSVIEHRGAPPPGRDAVWVLLAPRFALQPEERAAAAQWVAGGGRLVYGAPAEHDILAASLRLRGARALESPGAAGYVVGRGRVVLLSEGGRALTNASLAEQGLSTQAPWLAWITADSARVAFDEGRALGEPGLGPWEVPRRLGASSWLALASLLTWLWSRGERREPSLDAAPPGADDFDAHLNAVALMLRRGRRWRLVRRVLAGRPLAPASRPTEPPVQSSW